MEERKAIEKTGQVRKETRKRKCRQDWEKKGRDERNNI